jgi:hypothetical protein
VRQSEAIGAQLDVAEEEQVDVERARAVAGRIEGAAARYLDLLAEVEQLLGLELGANPDRRVEEVRLVEHLADRLGLIRGGDRLDLYPVLAQHRHRRAQVGLAVSDVRAQAQIAGTRNPHRSLGLFCLVLVGLFGSLVDDLDRNLLDRQRQRRLGLGGTDADGLAAIAFHQALTDDLGKSLEGAIAALGRGEGDDVADLGVVNRVVDAIGEHRVAVGHVEGDVELEPLPDLLLGVADAMVGIDREPSQLDLDPRLNTVAAWFVHVLNLADGQFAHPCEIVDSVADQVLIESRFRGPEKSGNGGYACGILARFLEPAPVEVTLRLPPPLNRDLTIEAGGGEAVMRDGEAIVAEAAAKGELELALPNPVGFEEAAAARKGSPLQRNHPFPACFVCGPERCEDGGLCLTCGPIEGGEAVAAPWLVDDSLPLDDGAVAAEFVWSVLDCPGGIAGMLVPDVGVCVLGRLAARIDGRIEPGMSCVAMGWPIDREGRKLRAGSAIFSADGEPLAQGLATWIELKS